MTYALKFVDADETIIRGLAIPFGGPIKGKDIDGEDFGPDTDLCLDWFPQGRPVLYHHGLNRAVKTSVVGRTDPELEIDDEGVWVKTELNKRARWYDRVRQLVNDEALGYSSGAMPHLVKATKSGHITRWPWVELSLTPTPANPAAVVYALKSALDDVTTTEDEDGSGPESFDAHAERVASDVAALVERAETRVDQRSAKAGRELSAANRAALLELDGKLAGWVSDIAKRRSQIKDLLARTDPDAKKALLDLEVELVVSELRRAGVQV
jgi:hypothetical protein